MHNIRNSAAASALAITVGLTVSSIKKGLKNFKGVQRRFNKIFTYNKVDFFDGEDDSEEEDDWQSAESHMVMLTKELKDYDPEAQSEPPTQDEIAWSYIAQSQSRV